MKVTYEEAQDLIKQYTEDTPPRIYQIAMLKDPISAELFIDISEDNYTNDAQRQAQLRAKRNRVIRELIQNLRQSSWYDESIPE